MIGVRNPAGDLPRPAPRRFASRYSRFVDLMKFLLPATALVLIGLVVLWPQLMGGYGSLIMPMLMRDVAGVGDAMVMHLPRYSGRTERAEPYEVVAKAATVDPVQPNRILLDQLSADLERSDASHLHLRANSGVFYRAIQKLNLAGDIELTTSDGYRFLTDSAQVSFTRGRVVGEEPVAGSGPAGTLAADRFEIRKGGDILRFEGRVRVTVQPEPPRGGAAS